MNEADQQQLTDYWHKNTCRLNEQIDDAFKLAQDQAYELGLKRGAPQWVKVSDKLPPAEVPVIAYFVNEHGKHRRIKAFYAPRFAVTTGVDNDWYEHKNIAPGVGPS